VSIKSIRIKNFQSHEDVTLDLSPGVNVVIGNSGSGKTALIRALQWIATNRPLGFGFHSTFASDPATSVDLTMTDGMVVSLSKTGKQATYSITKDGKSVGEWTTPGTAVPDEVLQLLNLSDLNIQSQLDPPFLITDSPGEVGRTLNAVTRIEKVDGWVSHFASEITSRNRLVSTMEGEQELVEKKLEELSFVERADQDLRNLETKFSGLQSLLDRLARISAMIKQLEDLDLQISTLSNQVTSLNALDAEVSGMVKKLEATSDQVSRLDALIESVQDLDLRINGLFKEEVKGAEKALIGTLRNLGTCPLCESPLTEAAIKRMVEKGKGA
jgi:DNA repair protein SbcC/Rad50